MAFMYNRPIGDTEAIEPIPEVYKGVNHSYRGIEDHGVPNTVEDAPNDPKELDYIAETSFDYPAETHTQEPVPVYVVNDSPVEEKRFLTAKFVIAGLTPVRIAVQDRRRMQLRICPMGTDLGIYIGPNESVNPEIGAALNSNFGYQDLVTTEDVWACTDTGDTVTVYVIYERWTDNRTVEDKVKKK